MCIFRFSDKNQKAIDLLRTKCLSLKSMVLCDGKLYEIMRGNFERADRRSVIRTTVNSKVTIHYLLTNYDELLFGWKTRHYLYLLNLHHLLWSSSLYNYYLTVHADKSMWVYQIQKPNKCLNYRQIDVRNLSETCWHIKKYITLKSKQPNIT